MAKFILWYTKSIFFSRGFVSNITSGDINLCKDMTWYKKLIESGFDSSKVFVIGDPYFDPLYFKIKNANIKSSVKTTKIRILFCTTTMSGHGFCSKNKETELIVNTVNMILKYKDFSISLKIHPSTVSKSDYEREIIPLFSSNIPLYQKENLVDLMNEHDIVLTYGSSGAIHTAVLLEKPIVNLNFDTEATSVNLFTDEKIITQCKNLSSLKSDIHDAVKKQILKEDVDRYVRKYIGILDGKCSERAADIICNFFNKT